MQAAQLTMLYVVLFGHSVYLHIILSSIRLLLAKISDFLQLLDLHFADVSLTCAQLSWLGMGTSIYT